jgi:CHAT domain-containing protein
MILHTRAVVAWACGLLLLSSRLHGATFADCDAQLAASPDAEDTAYCFYNLGRAPLNRDEAIARMGQVLGDSPDHPWFSFCLGRLEDDTGSPEIAETLFRRAAASFAARHDTRGEHVARSNLGRVLVHEHHPDEGELEQERAIAAARSSRDPLVRARGRVIEAKRLFDSGRRLHSAYALLRQADQLLGSQRSQPDHDKVLDPCLEDLGDVAGELGLSGESQRYYQRRLAMAKSDHEDFHAAAAQLGVARIAVELYNEAPTEKGKEQAIAETKSALDMSRKAGDGSTAVGASLILAGLVGRGAAQPFLDTCSSQKTDPADRSKCLNAQARHFAAMHDSSAAGAEAAEALRLAKDPWERVRAEGSAMRVAWAGGPLDQVIARGNDTLHAIEEIRGDQGISTSQAGLFSTWSDDFYWLAGRLLQQSRGRDEALLERAFSVTERLHARTLLDTLVKAQVAAPFREEVVERISALDEALARVRVRQADRAVPQLERDHAGEDAGALAGEERAAKAQLATLPAHPKKDSFATLELVRGHLAPNEALLSFLVAPWKDWTDDFGGGTWLVVATRGAPSRAYSLSRDRTKLRRDVDAFTGALQQPLRSKETVLAADLYRELLGTALRDLPPGIDHLIIVPDDALHRLPFAALGAASGAPPLVRRYRFTVIPSATLWLQWQGRRQRLPRRALALANPPLPDFAARQRFEEAGINIPYEALPGAEREAASAVRFLGGDCLVENAVSVSRLKSARLARFGLVDFATHSIVDDQDPESSGIWLSRGGKSGDGLLRMADIAGLPLPGRVVVLSTCSSARGKLLRGEGVLSLARAFFEAQASAVVASLWPQGDQDTAKLFDRFYRHLAEGRSLAAALAAAERDRIDEGAPTAAWAGFVVLGDGDLVPIPGGRSWIDLNREGLALAAALAILLALALALRHRRSGRGFFRRS